MSAVTETLDPTTVKSYGKWFFSWRTTPSSEDVVG
jgi:hypothetical protein